MWKCLLSKSGGWLDEHNWLQSVWQINLIYKWFVLTPDGQFGYAFEFMETDWFLINKAHIIYHIEITVPLAGR